MKYRSRLRDLSKILREVACEHEDYSQVVEIIQNCCNHIDAIARITEVNQNMVDKDDT